MQQTFYKLHGLGNDMIVIDDREERISPEEMPRVARKLCNRRTGLACADCPGNAFNVLNDQENASPESPLKEAAKSTGSTNYNYPYHGKAAKAGLTASDVAKALGWDETIWDLSGDLPFFVGGDAPVVVVDDNAGAQLPDFPEVPFN